MTEYKRSHEPVAWSLFGAGGMVVALLLPGIMLTTILVIPQISADNLYSWLEQVMQGWVIRIMMLIVISTSIYHTAHRMYHGLHDLHIEGNDTLMLSIFYGGATVLSLMCAAWLLVI